MSVGRIVGYTKAADGGTQHAGFNVSATLWTFLGEATGPYRISACEAYPYSDVDDMAESRGRRRAGPGGVGIGFGRT